MGEATSVFAFLTGRQADAATASRRAGGAEAPLSGAGSAFAAFLEAMNAFPGGASAAASAKLIDTDGQAASERRSDAADASALVAEATAFASPVPVPNDRPLGPPPSAMPAPTHPSGDDATATAEKPQSADTDPATAQGRTDTALRAGSAPTSFIDLATGFGATAEDPAPGTPFRAPNAPQTTTTPADVSPPGPSSAAKAGAAASAVSSAQQGAAGRSDATLFGAAALAAEASAADPSGQSALSSKPVAAPQAVARDASLRLTGEEDGELRRLLHRQEPERQSSSPRASRRPVPGDQATAQSQPLRIEPGAAVQQSFRITGVQSMSATPDDGADAWPEMPSSSLSAQQAYGGALSASTASLDGMRLDAPLRHLASDAARLDVQTVALRIAQKSEDGSRRFEIELDPPELGRVEVRLEFGRDGRVTTHMLVDRADTLDALLRDSRGLERALSASGLKLEGGIQYELRDQSSFAQSQGGRDQADGKAERSGQGSDDMNEPPAPSPPRHRLAGAGGLDVRI